MRIDLFTPLHGAGSISMRCNRVVQEFQADTRVFSLCLVNGNVIPFEMRSGSPCFLVEGLYTVLSNMFVARLGL